MTLDNKVTCMVSKIISNPKIVRKSVSPANLVLQKSKREDPKKHMRRDGLL